MSIWTDQFSHPDPWRLLSFLPAPRHLVVSSSRGHTRLFHQRSSVLRLGSLLTEHFLFSVLINPFFLLVSNLSYTNCHWHPLWRFSVSFSSGLYYCNLFFLLIFNLFLPILLYLMCLPRYLVSFALPQCLLYFLILFLFNDFIFIFILFFFSFSILTSNYHTP